MSLLSDHLLNCINETLLYLNVTCYWSKYWDRYCTELAASVKHSKNSLIYGSKLIDLQSTTSKCYVA